MIITDEDRKTAHTLLDRLMDSIDKGYKGDHIYWERIWFDDNCDILNRVAHKTRYMISLRMNTE